MKIDAKNAVHWVLGMVLAGLGVALCTKANFGLSMIGAGPYILHVWLRGSLPWFSQGTAEYAWEALLLIVMCLIVRRFRWRYLLSFCTAVISGLVIDLWLGVLGGNGAYEGMAVRIAAFLLGALSTGIGVAFFFRTNMPLQVYEMTVNELAAAFGWNKDRVKWGFDITMLALSLLICRILTRSWAGIGIGTLVITAINAPLIMLCGKAIDKAESALLGKGKQ